MHLTGLRLTNFRNYAALELPLTQGLTVLHGENAQGKTNVIEAVYMLATGSGYRAAADRELIRWEAPEAERLARVGGGVHPLGSPPFDLEVVVAAMPGVAGKRVLVNGAGKRLADFTGRLTAVLFGPEQLDLVIGSPSHRRAFLDEMLSQVSRPYVRELAVYGRALQQRNQLLKQFRERDVLPDELLYWDGQLVASGSAILASRARVLIELAPLAASHHRQLAPGEGAICLHYETKLFRQAGGWQRLAEAGVEDIQTEFRRWLEIEAERERAQGSSVVGPHRDDLLLSLEGQAVEKFGSRGQQRTVALALKLAELDVIRARTGDQPVLLLDDVLSELDPARRAALGQVMQRHEQVLLTAAERPAVPAAAAYEVKSGALLPG